MMYDLENTGPVGLGEVTACELALDLRQLCQQLFHKEVPLVGEDATALWARLGSRGQQSQASNIRHNNTSEVILKFQPFMKECIILLCLGSTKISQFDDFLRPKKVKRKVKG